jgi:hypothetical protein
MSNEYRITDMEKALELLWHIEQPCGVPGTDFNVRHVYIQMAINMIPNLRNPWARDMLQGAIKRYAP